MLPGIIGTLQATEAIKILAGIGEPMIGKLLHYDALSSRFKSFNIRQDPECALCGENPTINAPEKIKGYCNNEDSFPQIETEELRRIINQSKNYNLLDVRTDEEVNEYKIDPVFTKNYTNCCESDQKGYKIDQTLIKIDTKLVQS